MTGRPGLLTGAHRLALGLVGVPILAGVAGTLAPLRDAAVWDSLWAWPGLPRAVTLSVVTGLGSTLLSLGLTFVILAAGDGGRSLGWLRRALSPLLALPHAAAALGLAFLIAPSGWLVRLVSPWATGWSQPPDLLILNDPAGLALMLGLTAKELPFLLLMALAGLPGTDAARRGALAASLGYGRAWGFLITTAPALYRQLRLPAFAVLAYAMTTVDMGMILGPGLPPTLSVQITDWMTDPSLTHQPTAAAAALLQTALVGAVLALWLVTERLARPLIPALAARGWRARRLDAPAAALAYGAGLGMAASLGLGLAGLALWSLAGLWQFPAALPATLSLKTWASAAPDLVHSTATTLLIAALATLAALAATLACLEAEARHRLPADRAALLVYLPLLVPQIAFLPGLAVLLLHLGAKGGVLAVAMAHMVFVMPYVFLSLAPAYRAWDGRIALTAAALGAGPNRIFWRLRLPMLTGPLLTAAALGIAVSIGQYLPTILIGGGRVETLTTEAVALASGGNRRLIGATALLQAVLPALGFALALALPRLVFVNRRAMLAECTGAGRIG